MSVKGQDHSLNLVKGHSDFKVNTFFSQKQLGDLEPKFMKLGMLHCLCEYYQGCSNHDPGLTLTYFTSRSNLVTWAFVWKKVKIIYFLETIAALGLKLA